MSIWIGVDPGSKGAVAAIYNDNGVQRVAVAGWDNMLFVSFCKAFKDRADENGEQIVAAVEKVGAVKGNGITGMFNFGKNAGYIEGVLSTLNIGYQLIPPVVWKREFSIVGKDKSASIEVCKRLYPDVSLLPTERCRKESDGMADALCLATYAKRKL